VVVLDSSLSGLGETPFSTSFASLQGPCGWLSLWPSFPLFFRFVPRKFPDVTSRTSTSLLITTGENALRLVPTLPGLAFFPYGPRPFPFFESDNRVVLNAWDVGFLFPTSIFVFSQSKSLPFRLLILATGDVPPTGGFCRLSFFRLLSGPEAQIVFGFLPFAVLQSL